MIPDDAPQLRDLSDLPLELGNHSAQAGHMLDRHPDGTWFCATCTGTPTSDLLAILDAYQPMREAVRGLVAMFVSDGFTDEGARALTVHAVCGYRFNLPTDDGGESNG